MPSYGQQCMISEVSVTDFAEPNMGAVIMHVVRVAGASRVTKVLF